jgi:hypothetical protein
LFTDRGFLLDKSSLYLLYCSLFLPYITYCVEVWGTTYKTNTNEIYILQKKMIRLIAKADKYAHTGVLFKNFHILKFYDLLNFKISLFMYKVNNNLMPRNVQSIFNIHGLDDYYSLRSQGNFKTCYARTTLRSQSIAISGVIIYNNIPKNIREKRSVSSFKLSYKLFMLDKYE